MLLSGFLFEEKQWYINYEFLRHLLSLPGETELPKIISSICKPKSLEILHQHLKNHLPTALNRKAFAGICSIFVQMKIFAFIMAFTVIALSIMPCMDESEFNLAKVKTAVSKATSQSEHQESDNCSPFCSCSCCSASVTYQLIGYSYCLTSQFQGKKYSTYTSSSYSEMSFTIWQPPKLA
jgi:hypothetical protein